MISWLLSKSWRFQGLQDKCTNLDVIGGKAIQDVTTRLDEINAKLNSIEWQNDINEPRIASLDSGAKYLDETVDAHKEKIESLEERILGNTTRITALEAQSSRIESIYRSVTALERSADQRIETLANRINEVCDRLIDLENMKNKMQEAHRNAQFTKAWAHKWDKALIGFMSDNPPSQFTKLEGK